MGYARHVDRAATGFTGRLRTRVLPMLLMAGIAFILIYGIGDYPDHVIRHAQFYLAGLAMALTLPPAKREAGAA